MPPVLELVERDVDLKSAAAQYTDTVAHVFEIGQDVRRNEHARPGRRYVVDQSSERVASGDRVEVSEWLVERAPTGVRRGKAPARTACVDRRTRSLARLRALFCSAAIR
jgi:hypothetical protein